MPTPVDQLSFAGMVQRLSDLLDYWRSIVRRVLVQELTGPGPWTLTETDHGGKSLLVGNGPVTASIALTLPADAPVGTVFLVDQVEAGPARLVPATGATLHHRLGHTGTAGQWASLSVKCIRNADGAGAVYLLAGDTAAVA